MLFYVELLFIFLRFWFLEVPTSVFKFFIFLNKSFIQLVSLPLLIKTFFRPWKNEYREGLVGFSIVMGIFIKLFVILTDIFMLLVLLSLEIITTILFFCFPFAVILLLFIK
ncbi:MAG: hypothetical protein CO135_02635 [Candidatus Levybacteria bacterium CG_4_9_14_3_um_filter_35_16]|nr:MAG: hypothetical protein COW87_02400 [Candidatus Levybacteria bacterium CG22_combo_CG10-13_8_21_14_all_35_11]PJA91159.1 MAG: hypothetical protein CO135_02635 [Candidatus Levybacteria bacterium CG_4_9_14_3_um_filter_35_16]PJC54037.1 MAG: hypothetical protein CO028_04465 [Candidatus Levybacteria bacterium CG_4_9_14_0_2_um_filter_35_21]